MQNVLLDETLNQAEKRRVWEQAVQVGDSYYSLSHKEHGNIPIGQEAVPVKDPGPRAREPRALLHLLAAGRLQVPL